MSVPVARVVAGADHSDMQVCPGCGARALQGQASCEWCSAELAGRSLTAPLLPDELFWVQVSAEFKCQSCGELSPLNHIDADGAFECLRCQAKQDANPIVWEEGLAFGHAVAEIGGPNAGARRPKVDLAIGYSFDLSGLGSERSVVSMHIGQQHGHQIAGSPAEVEYRTLQMRASPGHPLCKRCKNLLKARPSTRGQLIASCSRCSSSETYTVATEELELNPALVGAMAEAYRVGHKSADSSSPTVEHWWLLFRGVSPERQLLAEAAKEREQDEREDEAGQERAQAEERALHAKVAEIERDAKRGLVIWLGGALALSAAAVALGLLLR